MKCTAKNVSVMGKINPLLRPPSLLISCFLANRISLILKKSKGLCFKNIDAAAGKVIAAISSSLCQGRIWHQKPRGFLNCFANAFKTKVLIAFTGAKSIKWETSPSLICLMNQKIKAIVNEKYCLIFLFLKYFTHCILGSCFIHSSW